MKATERRDSVSTTCKSSTRGCTSLVGAGGKDESVESVLISGSLRAKLCAVMAEKKYLVMNNAMLYAHNPNPGNALTPNRSAVTPHLFCFTHKIKFPWLSRQVMRYTPTAHIKASGRCQSKGCHSPLISNTSPSTQSPIRPVIPSITPNVYLYRWFN